jgi:Arc/MetJ-type ribon-helix-helix transcriptional regulator
MSGSTQNASEKKVNERTMITLRLPLRLYNDVKEDVDLVGDFGSISAWIQQAMREFYASRTELRNSRRERCSRPNLLPPSSHLVPFPADAGGIDTIVPFRPEYATEDREDGVMLHGIT